MTSRNHIGGDGDGDDEVDRIVAAWHRELPEVDTGALAVFSRVNRLARHLDRTRKAAFSAHGLEAFEFDVLTALRRAGAPYELTPGRLLEQTLVTSGTMTNRIDRMVAHGLVLRHGAPSDRRQVLVRLTDLGMAKVDAALVDLVERETELLGPLPPGDRETLADLLRLILRQFDSAGTR